MSAPEQRWAQEREDLVASTCAWSTADMQTLCNQVADVVRAAVLVSEQLSHLVALQSPIPVTPIVLDDLINSGSVAGIARKLERILVAVERNR